MPCGIAQVFSRAHAHVARGRTTIDTQSSNLWSSNSHGNHFRKSACDLLQCLNRRGGDVLPFKRRRIPCHKIGQALLPDRASPSTLSGHAERDTTFEKIASSPRRPSLWYNHRRRATVQSHSRSSKQRIDSAVSCCLGRARARAIR